MKYSCLAPPDFVARVRDQTVDFGGHLTNRRLVLLGVLLSTVGALLMYYWEQDVSLQEQRKEFQQASEAHRSRLQDKLDQALDDLSSLAMGYAAASVIDERVFRASSSAFFAREPSLHLLEWAPRVMGDSRDTQELLSDSSMSWRQSGDKAAHRKLSRIANRENYFPVEFAASRGDAEASVGLELNSHPVRQDALERALDSGMPTISAGIALSQKRRERDGFLVFVPVYDPTVPFDTPVQRREALRGFLVGGYSTEKLVSLALRHLEPPRIDLWLYDKHPDGGRQLLSWRPARSILPRPTVSAPQAPLTGVRSVNTIEAPNRSWALVSAAGDGQLEAAVSGWWLGLLAAGLSVTGLLAAYLSSIRSHAEILAFQAHHDPLTGLPNRYLLQDRIQQMTRQAERSKGLVALLLLDLDNFKWVNDSLGHASGDRLLQVTAERLSACIRECDTVARLGGDEFMVVVSIANGGEEQQISAVVQRVLGTVAQPLELEQQEVAVSCSMGISAYPRDGSDVQTLIKNADAAMYRAKEHGGSSFQFYQAAMNARALERLSLQGGLRRALERDQFRLHYQPQIEVSSGRIVGLEALIRWEHPDQGVISPAQFIPLAEETGLIVPIGEWVLRTACRQAKNWQEQGLPLLTIAVNLSARQFQRGGLIQVVDRVLAETRLDATLLELELTESLLMKNTDEALTILTCLKDRGIKLSIDDFGTGYSSLGYLTRFPVDRVKIDQSFVRDLATDPNDAAIAKAVIAMAHSLRLSATAEGVETAEQLAFLRGHRCNEVQGYYFSRPLPPDQLANFLSRTPTLAVGLPAPSVRDQLLSA